MKSIHIYAYSTAFKTSAGSGLAVAEGRNVACVKPDT
jgi:hypothetical protein